MTKHRQQTVFEAWQQHECSRLRITVEEHYQIMGGAARLHARDNTAGGYDALVKSLVTKSKGPDDDDGPFDTGEGDDPNGPYGT